MKVDNEGSNIMALQLNVSIQITGHGTNLRLKMTAKIPMQTITKQPNVIPAIAADDIPERTYK